MTHYPWASQRCYGVEDNLSNLFEFNIVKVSKNKEGKIVCDFSAFDRYIEIFMKHRIDEEINLFGMLVPLEIPSKITKIYFEKFGNSIQSISLNTCEVVKNMNDLSEIKQEVQNKNGRMTWFSCCSPEDLNIFIKSPLIRAG